MIPDTTAKMIRKLQTSAHNVVTARNADARTAAMGFMVKRAGELCQRRNTLLEKIEAGWSWLEPYDYEDPEVRKEEDQFVAWNAELRQITDALDDAERAISGEAAA